MDGGRTRVIFAGLCVLVWVSGRNKPRSPAEQSHRLLAVARSHLPCKAKEAFKEVES